MRTGVYKRSIDNDVLTDKEWNELFNLYNELLLLKQEKFIPAWVGHHLSALFTVLAKTMNNKNMNANLADCLSRPNRPPCEKVAKLYHEIFDLQNKVRGTATPKLAGRGSV